MWEERLPAGHVYELPPIDWWTAWTSFEEAGERVEDHAGSRERTRRELERTLEHALEQFRSRTTWEGDVTQGPYLAGLPPDDGNADGDVMVGLKQHNNGMTFIWSPHSLSWIGQYERG